MAKFTVETKLICQIVIEADSYAAAREKVDKLEEKGLCWDHYVVDQTETKINFSYTDLPVTNL